jgi:hypothetical protein
MAVALGKKSNDAGGRFGRALRGLHGFPLAAKASLYGQSFRILLTPLTYIHVGDQPIVAKPP